MVRGYTDIYQSDLKDLIIKPNNVEVDFLVKLKHFDFSGKIDLLPCYRKSGKPIIVEHKTASKIGDSYIDRLPLDTQIRGYIFGAQEGLGLHPVEVLYDVIRKCSLRRKSDEDLDDFNERIALDYASRPEFYFFRETLKFNSSDIGQFVNDMDLTFSEYSNIVDNYDPKNPASWVCSDNICNEFFKNCPYMPLCLKGLDKGTGKLYTQVDDDDSDELVNE